MKNNKNILKPKREGNAIAQNKVKIFHIPLTILKRKNGDEKRSDKKWY